MSPRRALLEKVQEVELVSCFDLALSYRHSEQRLALHLCPKSNETADMAKRCRLKRLEAD